MRYWLVALISVLPIPLGACESQFMAPFQLIETEVQKRSNDVHASIATFIQLEEQLYALIQKANRGELEGYVRPTSSLVRSGDSSDPVVHISIGFDPAQTELSRHPEMVRLQGEWLQALQQQPYGRILDEFEAVLIRLEETAEEWLVQDDVDPATLGPLVATVSTILEPIELTLRQYKHLNVMTSRRFAVSGGFVRRAAEDFMLRNQESTSLVRQAEELRGFIGDIYETLESVAFVHGLDEE